MPRPPRHAPALAALALGLCAAALLMAACAAGDARDDRSRAAALSGPQLLHRRQALTDEIRTLDSEADGPPPAAAGAPEAAPRARRLEQARRELRQVNTLLAEGGHAVHELRYKVAPAPKAEPEASPAPKAEVPAPATPGPVHPASPAPPAPGAATAPGPDAAPPGAPDSPAPQAPQATVTAVAWAEADGGLAVRVAMSGPGVPRCRVFTLDGPPRLVLDVLDAAQPPADLPAAQAVGGPLALGLRTGWHPGAGFVRVVLDLRRAGVRHALAATPGQAVLTLRP